MANDVKWIKLKVGMFNGDSFKRIRKAEIGGVKFRDKLTAVWFELMDFAGKCNHSGAFINAREIPYSSLADIAIMIDRETEELELCMKFYVNEGMVEIIDDVFMLANWTQYQNEEGLDKIREQRRLAQARWRANKRAGLAGGKIETCAYCGETADTIDHVIPRSKGGQDIEENIVPCCKRCNSRKGGRDLVEFLNDNRDDIDIDLILSNPKLMVNVDEKCRFYTPSTHHLPSYSYSLSSTSSSPSNKGESEGETKSPKKPSKAEIDAFFEEIWKLYPVKKGKGSVSDAQKKKLYAIGVDEIRRAIDRYLEDLKKDASWRKPKHGSTFFNSGYVDFLDKNFVPDGGEVDEANSGDHGESQQYGTYL